MNPEINTKHAQLIFTTHDTWQLSNQLLRRDEVWFTEKDEQGISKLYIMIPELGYYLVVTDTEATEKCYFQGLHKELPKEIQNKLVIKIMETKTKAMIDKCLAMTAYDAQYCIPRIVFDRDEVKDFDYMIKEAASFGIRVG